MDGKKTKRCEQGGKICIFNLGDRPFERYLSASHYSSTTWHFSLSPEAPHIKKTSVAFGTFAFTTDLWGLSAQGGKLPFIIQTLQKKKLTDKLEFCRQAFPLVDTAPGDGWHKAAVWGDTACCPRAGAPEWSVAAGGASISGSQRDAAQRRAARPPLPRLKDDTRLRWSAWSQQKTNCCFTVFSPLLSYRRDRRLPSRPRTTRTQKLWCIKVKLQKKKIDLFFISVMMSHTS